LSARYALAARIGPIWIGLVQAVLAECQKNVVPRQAKSSLRLPETGGPAWRRDEVNTWMFLSKLAHVLAQKGIGAVTLEAGF
jgi:hypothetical protein